MSDDMNSSDPESEPTNMDIEEPPLINGDNQEETHEQAQEENALPLPQIDWQETATVDLTNSNLHPGPVQAIVFEATLQGQEPVNGTEIAIALTNLLNIRGSGDTCDARSARPHGAANNDGSSGGNNGGSPGGNGNGNPKALTFKDCGGLEPQVNYLKTAVLRPLSSNNKGNNKFGLEPPKGILFHGPPGTGKTRLALALGEELRKVLGASKVTFIYRKGKDVASKWFGESSENLRAVFDEAIRKQPSVIFFDELDGLCPSRDKPNAHQPNITIVTTMLGLIDNLPKGKVFVIGATNMVSNIDPAVLRPGRFDKHLVFLPPSETGRLDILRIHTRNWKVKPEDNLLRQLSQQTVGFTGADLAKLCLDAFDSALNRCIGPDGEFKNKDFKNLNVDEQDWKNALSKMKASNSAVFGSSLYVPPTGMGEHVSALLKANTQAIVNLIANLLPPVKSTSPCCTIRSLHVCSRSDNILGNLDEYVIAECLRHQEIGNYNVHTLSPAVLASARINMWGSKINEVFSQILGSSKPSILYVQEVGELWGMLTTAKLGSILNLNKEFERLRGKHVLVLTTGLHPSTIPEDNPFKSFLLGTARIHEVQPPTDQERSDLFQETFSAAVISTTEKWTDLKLQMIGQTFENAVAFTKNAHFGPIIRLHDELQQVLMNAEAVGNVTNDGIIQSLAEKVGAFRMANPSPGGNN